MSIGSGNVDLPQPGEIWAVIGSDPDDSHWVTIVREPQSEDGASCAVMLLSAAIEYLSDANILIPPPISGLEIDILAETWNVERLPLTCLKKQVGRRLSRQIYDLLLSIGDAALGLAFTRPSTAEIRSLGLLVLPDRSTCHDRRLQHFHDRERALLFSFDPTKIDRVSNLIDRAISIKLSPTILTDWFKNSGDRHWQDCQNRSQSTAIAVRSINNEAEIQQTIATLAETNNEDLRRQLIDRLSTAIGNPAAIQSLVNVLETTSNDETLWLAVDSLRRLDPDHPALGIRRSKSVDLGMGVEFVVSIIPKVADRFGILLQVYPRSGLASLPAHLKLILEDEAGNSLREVVAREGDLCIQLKLSGTSREIFSVCLELDGAIAIEDFVI